MDYRDYICTELLVLIPVLYFIGLGVKKSKVPNKWIPIILGISGIVLSSLWVLSTKTITNYQDFAAAIFASITQGILVAGTSVFVNQIIVQSKKNN